MGKIVVVGLGPGELGALTLDGWQWLTGDSPVFLRTAKHPVAAQLKERGVKWQSFDRFYEDGVSFDQVYRQITEFLLAKGAEQDLVYGVPGHPLVAETTVNKLIAAAEKMRIKVILVPGVSFLDACYNTLGIDPVAGLVVHDGLGLTVAQLVVEKGQIICQVYNQRVASEVKLTLMEKLPDDYLVIVITAAGIPGLEKVEQIPLFMLDRLEYLDHLTSVYVPPQEQSRPEPDESSQEKIATGYSLEPIVNIMARLRSEQGCPWDREQSHHTLRKYLIEETYEVIEAIEEKSMYKLCDELGDLLLQIVFHAQIAGENGHFDINDVVEAIAAKMVRRHPHVFGQGSADTSDEVIRTWEQIKKEELWQRGSEATLSILRVPPGLPALMKAQKLQQQAARVGFDWPNLAGVLAKVREELVELTAALAGSDGEQVQEELGDLIFSLVNLARFIKLDAEEVLRHACEKFRIRFNLMEKEAREDNVELNTMKLHELEKLWLKAKRNSIKSGNS